jgi:hypothetical protein
VFASDRTFDDVSLAVFQDFSKKCSNSRTDSKFQDIPGKIFFPGFPGRVGGLILYFIFFYSNLILVGTC